MIELSINNLTKCYGANKIFENITFEVKTSERIGLIGRNGCGKTTIMKIIMGKYLENLPLNLSTGTDTRQDYIMNTADIQEITEDFQGGEVNLKKDVKTGYLNQIPVYREDTKALDVVRMAFGKIFELKNQMKEFENRLESLTGEALEKAVHSYGKLTERYELADGYGLETKINKITEGLKISDAMKQMPFEQLSGGEKTRIILAKILLEEPDILLLDEPTNHLDLETVEWLEGFLKNYKGSVLIISHDRYFLDSVVGKIVELEFNRANIYPGNYSYYVLEKERRFLIDYKNYLNQQKKIEQMEKQIERYRIWGEMRDSDKMYRRAKELEKRLEKIEVLDKPVRNGRKVRFNQESGSRTGKIVLETEHINKSFGEMSLLWDINMHIYYQDSACIIGRNGCGKSTLLKMILGEIQPDSGIIKIGAQVKIGYLPQQVIFEDEDQTILEYFARLHNITYETARAQLAGVLFFRDDVHKKIRFLSGGEKSRLRLCSLTFEKVNFMILDEPTNHLDIDSREVLEETLAEYEGTLLFVSHDRYFINKVADKILTIENNTLKTYPGDYDYYLEEYQKIIRKDGEFTKKEDNELRKKECPKRMENHPKKPEKQRSMAKNEPGRKLEILEKEIEEMEIQLKFLEEEMNTHNTEVEYLKELFSKKEKVEKQLNLAYDRWESFQS